jgi:hypothetical protein
MHVSPLRCVLHAPLISVSHPNNIWWNVQVTKLLIMKSFLAPRNFLFCQQTYTAWCLQQGFHQADLSRRDAGNAVVSSRRHGHRCGPYFLLWADKPLFPYHPSYSLRAYLQLLLVLFRLQSSRGSDFMDRSAPVLCKEKQRHAVLYNSGRSHGETRNFITNCKSFRQ